MAHRTSLTLALTLGSIVLLFGALLVFMGHLGFFSFTGSDSSAKVVAAALALVGTFLGAAVSISGTIVKHSIDQQTASQQGDAEKRLKLEAAVRALQLFSTSTGDPTPAIQREGALFMLANLGQHELTLQLVEELLDKKEVSAGAAATILNEALKNASEDDKIRAVNVLSNHTDRLVTTEGVDLPESLLNWGPGFSKYVREWAVVSLAQALLAMPLSHWTAAFPYQANSVLAALGLAWAEETDPGLKADTGALLRPILAAFPEVHNLKHPRGIVDTDQIRTEVGGLVPRGQAVVDLVAHLTLWASVEEGQVTAEQAHS